MKVSAVSTRLRTWLAALFVKAINGMSRQEDRADAVRWLALSQDIVASDTSAREKFVALNSQINARKTASVIAHSVAEAVRNYKNSDLPLPVKIAVPVTLLAVPFVGGQGAGVAALGTAAGVPALLLVFLGAAGISSILEALAQGGAGMGDLARVLELIAHDEILRRTSTAMQKAMQDEPKGAFRRDMPMAEIELRDALLTMDPFAFESHVVGFFAAQGMEAWVTRKSNDFGVDGFARHPDGLIVVQCKRNGPGNPVGRPVVQQFKGVVEENGAWRGYIVTTSSFTEEARTSAALSERIVLVDMDELIRWHLDGAEKAPHPGPPPAEPGEGECGGTV
ncbi:restriction endonuclease [Paramagnetospirillum kuznetsovii]|uniref:Restriction endonuclease n=1 Tax=Paramagnetospirillum kuznetsovii TaxID=2053833 RepID=A0A364NWB4_9PROT|nr:restriction endonuclease [Paramagnetospirillum kuznetsovii]RAU21371.1 restriction endonuclease [Paramagnetospirillum kuznetsovii]